MRKILLISIAYFLVACSNKVSLPLEYVGELRFDKIERIDRNVVLDITVTDGVWYKQPEIYLKEIEATVNNNMIVLEAVAGGKKQDEDYSDHLIHQVTLKKLPKGTYYIYYKDPSGVMTSLDKITL